MYLEQKFRDPGLTSEHYLELFTPGMNHFQGSHVQRGHGLIGDLIRDYALPFLRRAFPHVLEGIQNIVHDVREGKNFGESLKTHARKTVKRTLVGEGQDPVKRPRKEKQYPLFASD